MEVESEVSLARFVLGFLFGGSVYYVPSSRQRPVQELWRRRVLTGVRDGSFRRSSQKSEGIRTLRDARVERNCLEKLSSVMIAILRRVLGVGDIGIGADGGVSNVRHVSSGLGLPDFHGVLELCHRVSLGRILGKVPPSFVDGFCVGGSESWDGITSR